MSTLDDLRRRFAETASAQEETPEEPAPRPLRESPMDKALRRLRAGQCPVCESGDFIYMGAATLGTSIKCRSCTFQFVLRGKPRMPELDDLFGPTKHEVPGISDSEWTEHYQYYKEIGRQAVRKIFANSRADSKSKALDVHRHRCKYRTLTTPGGLPDAELEFGKHAFKTISQLSLSMEGRDYLRWMRKEDFPAALIDIINEHLP